MNRRLEYQMDQTFLTRGHGKQKSAFEVKYLERFGTSGENRVGLPGLSPQLIEKQRELERTNTQLEDARNKFETWKTNFQRKKKEIDEKQQQLAEQKRHLDAFTAQQMAALEKAKKRESEEIEQSRIIDSQLKTLMEEENELKQENDQLRTELDTLQPCADYLQSVVDICPTFDNIESILNRHQSLAATRVEYQEKYQTLMGRYGTDETQLAQQLEIRRSHLVDCTMKYNEGLSRVAQVRKRNEYRRTTLIKDIQRIEGKNIELTAIKTSIRTIYNRALGQSTTMADQIQRAKGTDVNEEGMLEYIENRFHDLKDIIEDKAVVYIQSLSEPLSVPPTTKTGAMSPSGTPVQHRLGAVQ
jgi:DNA repair exonuclease SbcCD ATPase subunit